MSFPFLLRFFAPCFCAASRVVAGSLLLDPTNKSAASRTSLVLFEGSSSSSSAEANMSRILVRLMAPCSVNPGDAIALLARSKMSGRAHQFASARVRSACSSGVSPSNFGKVHPSD